MQAMKRQAPTKTHRQMVAEWKKDPEFQVAYDELDTEFALLRQLLAARRKAGLTQAGVAAKMGTRPPAVTRLETALSANLHSPTLATLKKYARAVGCKLEVHLVPSKVR
jgi:ribosome-binding protein aMBF1 (putative translation factor)